MSPRLVGGDEPVTISAFNQPTSSRRVCNYHLPSNSIENVFFFFFLSCSIGIAGLVRAGGMAKEAKSQYKALMLLGAKIPI